MEKILYVTSSPAMSSFASGFLRSAIGSSCIKPYVAIFIEFEDNRSDSEIIEDYGLNSVNISTIQIIKYLKSKWVRHVFSDCYIKLVNDFAHLNNIKVVHFLTQDSFIAFRLYRLKGLKLFYTVHDLEQHEAKLSVWSAISRYLFLTIKDRWIVKNIDNLVTSSEHQLSALKTIYPNKSIHQHDMPSLVTTKILAGNKKVKEIENLNSYVLFFGRIEFYKGIETLYEAFIKSNELENIPLVIAGKGQIYFNRDIINENSIYFVNRFILDEEMNDLFKNAKIVVLPYISSTQSALASLCYHYNKPFIASDIPGLRESLIDGETALLYKPYIDNDLESKIIKLLYDTELYNNIIFNQVKQVKSFYDSESLLSQIELLYM